MQPLIRWVIGPVSDNGFECLRLSVKLAQRLYPECRFAVCHNGMSNEQLASLPPVELVDQSSFVNSIELPPPNEVGKPAWKLYPPRLNEEGHEIILDNDILLYKRSELIDEFLGRKDLCLVTEAYKRSYGVRFEDLVPPDFNINSGVVCLNPGFNYWRSIKSVLDYGKKIGFVAWEDHFDEQTVVATILSRQNTKIIPLEDIHVCAADYRKGRIGMHFVGLNGSEDQHWLRYLTERDWI